ncbi:secreted protein/lipoprotein [Streptomyces avidinii]|uniref:secreted protein/lipoprotein n=1 Tax=Streptomyces avidinii TaxID=1895 RepID=UPI0028879B98|nr:secreted protein/lipoprotein [Streptomyces sp. DSM 41633]
MPSKSASMDPAEAAKAEAISAYQSYWTELPKAYAVPAIEGTELQRYTAAEALAKAQAGVANLKTLGQIMTGAPVLTNPTVTGAELDKKTPNVTISACLDVLPWKLIQKDTGQPAPLPSTRATKYVVIALVERWEDGWKVLKSTPHGDQPC